MGRKKKKVEKPWCWYCNREFDDEKILVQHQKAKHFKCHICHKKLFSGPGLSIHCMQVHKETIDKIPGSLPHRDNIHIEIFGMQGVPAGATRGASEEDEPSRKRAAIEPPASILPPRPPPMPAAAPPMPFAPFPSAFGMPPGMPPYMPPPMMPSAAAFGGAPPASIAMPPMPPMPPMPGFPRQRGFGPPVTAIPPAMPGMMPSAMPPIPTPSVFNPPQPVQKEEGPWHGGHDYKAERSETGDSSKHDSGYGNGSSSSHAGYSGSSASMASKLGTKTRIVHPDDHSISLVSYFSSIILREYYFIISRRKATLVVGNLEMHIFCGHFKMPPKLLRGLMIVLSH
ncbi:hypothetical protein WR25_10181 isoform C [Diploscapter pachys]|uniref:BED-type domain-containing protein n=1 Tax=Diploscapter pachys TaxID=2018661 RepID=A0A2A2KLX5_9BILA|nr:hypothetical protein WR25_10181 isoform C [Diploscapter pachys]